MTTLSAFVVPIVTVGMLWVVPTGLGLVEGPRPPGWEALRRAWPLLALPGAVSLWLPRSGAAVALAACYALATLALALQAPARLALVLRRTATGPTGGPSWPAEVAVLTALVSPSVAGLALVAERASYPLFGFELDLLALTVPHFHFAGFAAALVAGLLCRTAGGGALATTAALSVPAGTLLVLIGYFVDDWAELAGAVVLTVGMAAVSVLTLRERRGLAADPATRTLLGVSALVLAATMALALWWALGEATGLPHPTLTWMAATHGLGNALGFAVCALLAHRRLRPADGRHPSPAPAPAPLPRTELPA
ncbi:YndJ family transporter [Streptomyces sp. R302]|uniref:YndJ family protein n=1 Tax=unclassified Streptomyces TaxID=2593676 RepID=UPI00145F20D2|nr:MULTISPECIES: YndJ family protein [unclassified Streptomyces]NML50790.1 YndJ family transporter [Streptomyces sp. R301]NML80885.1 YndJ family transporter [Streptomyces sp. R302]